MMPRTILIIENMPLNDNGKVDRKRLINYDWRKKNIIWYMWG